MESKLWAVCVAIGGNRAGPVEMWGRASAPGRRQG